VPDFSVVTVRKFLEVFYTGFTEISSFTELQAIKDFGFGTGPILRNSL
jgi:hypothetical protein